MIDRQRHLHRLHGLQIASLETGSGDQRRNWRITDGLVYPLHTAVT
jgi:hypothetical protein